jgi:hypothetical protein
MNPSEREARRHEPPAGWPRATFEAITDALASALVIAVHSSPSAASAPAPSPTPRRKGRRPQRARVNGKPSRALRELEQGCARAIERDEDSPGGR